ncbi:SDR family oxidoreductase [Hymenobacter sp. PAMC 26628]|uniref:SDR family oxidoreductase n=1 Tax=Hymenobacter sp. PAMC 26628 TaxID=1484118 RepID=UPI00077029EC|nr:SDR family oxidoreductase [Hymenobacter sp. PAMC 26628]AMJ67815.1 3-beta hydroxysteroid dehydrogenase [Hymenobacter sp. PAMC 26628]
MRVFVTGATGFIGAAVVQELLDAGHQVLGLARSRAAALKLATAGAQAHEGALDDLASLRTGAAAADGVIHLAYIHEFSYAPLSTRLRVLLGGLPGGIAARFIGAIGEADQRAVEALGEALAGSGRPLVVTSGIAALAAGRLTSEDEAGDPGSIAAHRLASEDVALALAAQGVRASVVRLPPTVHGDGDTGFVPRLIGIARKKGVSAYVGDGLNRWSAVHRLDAAHLFRLALEQGTAGARYHGVAEEGISTKEIAALIGRRLHMPVVGQSTQEAGRHFGFLGPLFGTDNPASSTLTQARLGWQPTQPGLLADLAQSTTYFDH